MPLSSQPPAVSSTQRAAIATNSSRKTFVSQRISATLDPTSSKAHSMKVKMILPALTEATSPFWRPIKYSLFPPLGLATLAGYLGAGRRDRPFRTSTSSGSTSTTSPIWSPSRSTSPRPTGPTRSPITTARKACTWRWAACTSPRCPDEAAPHADTIFLGPGEDTWPQFLADFRAGRPAQRVLPIGRCARSIGHAADPA